MSNVSLPNQQESPFDLEAFLDLAKQLAVMAENRGSAVESRMDPKEIYSEAWCVQDHASSKYQQFASELAFFSEQAIRLEADLVENTGAAAPMEVGR